MKDKSKPTGSLLALDKQDKGQMTTRPKPLRLRNREQNRNSNLLAIDRNNAPPTGSHS